MASPAQILCLRSRSRRTRSTRARAGSASSSFATAMAWAHLGQCAASLLRRSDTAIRNRATQPGHTTGARPSRESVTSSTARLCSARVFPLRLYRVCLDLIPAFLVPSYIALIFRHFCVLSSRFRLRTECGVAGARRRRFSGPNSWRRGRSEAAAIALGLKGLGIRPGAIAAGRSGREDCPAGTCGFQPGPAVQPDRSHAHSVRADAPMRCTCGGAGCARRLLSRPLWRRLDRPASPWRARPWCASPWCEDGNAASGPRPRCPARPRAPARARPRPAPDGR